MDWALVLVSLTYLFITPFTKVEESFNIQAAHDVLFHQWNISNYDHLEFPGVVPRTFIGPLFLSILSAPLVFLTNCFGIGSYFFAQNIVRASLSICVCISLLRFQETLQKSLGKGWGWWYLVVTISQYHFLYYSSRPLPNILAIPFVLLALSAAFTPNGNKWFLILSGAAIIWFRTELALLLGIILLIQLFDSKVKLDELIKIIVPAGIGLIAITVIIDSIFWQRIVWPEAEVFYFNAILGKSSEWGTSPFLWYFYSALPRGLGTSVFLLPIGLFYEARVRRLVAAAAAFICLFSFLPHKELRFIIYTFPLLNTAVAAACQRLWSNRNKSPLRWLLAVGVIGHLLLNIVFTLFLVMVARVNYPGGEAMARLHQLVPSDVPVFVHIDNLSAQTGVTRFTQINPSWRYSKEENLLPGSPEMYQFTHLLVEAKSKYSANLKAYKKSHSILASVEGFSELIVNYQTFPPIRFKTKPLIFIMERNEDFEVPEFWNENEKVLLDDFNYDGDESADETDVIDDIAEQRSDESNAEEPNDNTEQPKDDITKESLEINEVVPDVSQETLDDDDMTEELQINNTDDVDIVESKESSDNLVSNEQVYDEVEDDLVAIDSKAVPQIDSSDLEAIVQELEEKLSSKESNDKNGDFNDALFDSDILKDIKELTNLDFKGATPSIDELKSALKMILSEFKENLEDNSSKNKLKEMDSKESEESNEDSRIDR